MDEGVSVCPGPADRALASETDTVVTLVKIAGGSEGDGMTAETAGGWQVVAERPLWPDYGIGPEHDGMLAWEWAEGELVNARNYWLATTRPDGRPHVAPVWGVWLDGCLYFGTGRRSVKGRNLAAQPRVAVHLESGDDTVIIEGLVTEVTDPAERNRVAARYQDKYGLPPEGPEGSDSPLLAVRPITGFGWREQSYPATVTRWRFQAGA